MNKEKYSYEPEEIKRANNNLPLISKIKLGAKEFNITSPKDWSESDPAQRAYIHGRTHYNSKDVSFTKAEVERMYTEPSHEYYFQSRYTFTNSTDHWMPTVPWFSATKPYNLVVMENEIEYRTTDSWDLSGGSCTLKSSNGNRTITVDFTATEGFSINSMDTPTLIIRPVASDVKYDMLKQLDGLYIPVDNKTIRYNSETGKIQTDALFDTKTITFSQDFGKFKANEEVDVSGLTLIDLFTEALCSDKVPEIEVAPELLITFTGETEVAKGDSIDLRWEVQFNPGKYSYGTLFKNDSDIYVKQIDLDFEDTSSTFTNYQFSVQDGTFSQLSETSASLLFPVPEKEQNKEGLKTLASGSFKADAFNKGQANLTISITYNKVHYEENSETTFDEAVSDKANILSEHNKVQMSYPETVTKSCAISTDLNWFWGMQKNNEAIDHTKRIPVLGGLPAQITTEGAQQWYFIAPKDMIEELEMLNIKTGTTAGIVQKADPITIADDNYDVYRIINAVPDLNKNIYEIRYSIKTGGVAE